MLPDDILPRKTGSGLLVTVRMVHGKLQMTARKTLKIFLPAVQPTTPSMFTSMMKPRSMFIWVIHQVTWEVIITGLQWFTVQDGITGHGTAAYIIQGQ